MRPIPVAQYLDRLAAARSIARMSAAAMLSADATDADAAAGGDLEREAAYLRGVADGQTKAAAAHERALEDERAATQARLHEAQARWAGEAGARLVETLHGALETLGERVTDQAGRLLEPFVEARILAHATAELRAALGVLLAGAPGVGVRVCGPADLLSAMRAGVGQSAASIDYVEADGIDVRIVAADTIIESRLTAWMDRLREAVA